MARSTNIITSIMRLHISLKITIIVVPFMDEKKMFAILTEASGNFVDRLC